MLVCKIKKSMSAFTLDVDFTAADSVTALMGASGSGKSMALRCIAGICKPDEGLIELNGVTLFDSEKKINLPPQKRNTSFLFQDYALFPNMTVRQNIECGIKNKKSFVSACLCEVSSLINAYQLSSHLDKYPHQLSGGEKQRCALARIIAGSPDILMLDEPFSSLDDHLRWELEMEIAAVFKNFEKTVLYVSHSRDEVYRLCDNVVIMNNGRSETAGEKTALFKNPVTVQAARLTGCKNIASAIVSGRQISVPDWGIEFDTDREQSGINFVGIRANHIVHKSAAANVSTSFNVAASFPFEIVSEIEDTFTSILMVRKSGTQLPPIRWEMPKKNRAALKEASQELAFLRENILLLKQGDNL